MLLCPPAPEALLALARRVLDIEADALRIMSGRLDAGFADAVRLILACTGRVVVTGMGKSGHVGGKIAATLASTGTPAFFMHPGEASHGDLGMIAHDDVVLALSNSGESSEIVSIVPLIKRRGTRLVAMTGNPDSPLAKIADDVLLVASPHGYLQPADLSARLCQLYVVDLLYLLVAQSDFDKTTRLLAATAAAVAPRRRPPRATHLPYSAEPDMPAQLSKQTS